MSRNVSHTPTEDGDDLDAGREVSLGGLFDRVNRFFYNKTVGLGLILSMAVLTLLGTLLEQAPAGVREDPKAFADWVTTVRPRYGGWTPVLDRLGLFQVFSTWWFRGVTVLLALSIIACTAHRLPQLWRRAVHPKTHTTDNFFVHAALHETVDLPLTPQQSLERATQALRGHRYRTIVDDRGQGSSLYADRFRWMPFGTAIAHASFVIILIGCLVTSTVGFKDDDFTATVGMPREVGHGTGLSVLATSFTDSYYADGRPKDYVSQLVLSKDGRQVAAQQVRVNTPLRYDGVKIHQVSFGIAAVVKIADRAGRVLYEGGVPLQYTTDDEQNTFGRVTIPGSSLIAYVITPASGQVDSTIGAGQAQVEVYEPEGDKPVASGVLSQGAPTPLGDHTVTFVRERQYTGLSVSRDPGATWVWIGSALMMIGLLTTLYFRHRRIWVRVEPTATGSRVELGSPERHDTAFENWFHRLGHELRLPDPATTGPDREKVTSDA